MAETTEQKTSDDPQRIELEKTAIFTGAFTSISNNLIKWGGLLGIAYFTYLSIKELAGQETITNIVVNLITDLKVNEYLAYLVGGSGAAYGCIQKRSKKQTIERIHYRKQQLEELIDPNRKSSKLTVQGETRPEDR